VYLPKPAPQLDLRWNLVGEGRGKGRSDGGLSKEVKHLAYGDGIASPCSAQGKGKSTLGKTEKHRKARRATMDCRTISLPKGEK